MRPPWEIAADRPETPGAGCAAGLAALVVVFAVALLIFLLLGIDPR